MLSLLSLGEYSLLSTHMFGVVFVVEVVALALLFFFFLNAVLSHTNREIKLRKEEELGDRKFQTLALNKCW